MIFNWIAGITSRAPLAVAALFGIVTAAAMYQASKLKFEGDVTALLPAEDTALYREIIDQSGSNADLVILLEDDDPEKLLAAAEEFDRVLRKHPNVSSVRYRAEATGPLSIDDAPQLTREAMTQRFKYVRKKLPHAAGPAKALLMEDPLGLKESMGKKAKERFGGFRFNLSKGAFFSEDQKALLLVVTGREKPHNLVAASSTMDAARGVKVPVRVSMTGGYAVSTSMRDELRGDFFFTAILSLIGVTLMFLLGFREWRSVPFAALPVAVGTVITLGITQLLFDRLTPITVAFAPMVIGLGIDFPIHFYNRWRVEGDIRKALVGIGPSIFFAALTTSAVLLSLAPSRLPAYRDLGIISGIGVFLILTATVFLCPLLARSRKVTREGGIRIVPFARRLFPLVVLVTLVLAFYARKGIRHETDSSRLIGDAPVFKTQKRISKIFGGTLESIFFVSRSPESAKQLEADLEELVKKGIFSGVMPAPRPYQGAGSPQEARQAFREDFRAALKSAGFQNPEAFADYREWISGRIAETPPALLVSIGMLRDRLRMRDHRAYVHRTILETTGTEFTGGSVMTEQLDHTYRADAARAAYYSVLGILLLTAVYGGLILKRPSTIIVACLPVLIGFLWTLGLMNLLNISVGPLSIIVFILITGILIDHGLHLVGRSRQIGGAAASAELVRPIVLTSGTSIIGFGVLILASHPMLQALGKVLVLGITAGLFGTLLFVPPILSWIYRKPATAGNDVPPSTDD